MQGVTFSSENVSVPSNFEAMYDASCELWSRVRPLLYHEAAACLRTRQRA